MILVFRDLRISYAVTNIPRSTSSSWWRYVCRLPPVALAGSVNVMGYVYQYPKCDLEIYYLLRCGKPGFCVTAGGHSPIIR